MHEYEPLLIQLKEYRGKLQSANLSDARKMVVNLFTFIHSIVILDAFFERKINIHKEILKAQDIDDLHNQFFKLLPTFFRVAVSLLRTSYDGRIAYKCGIWSGDTRYGGNKLVRRILQKDNWKSPAQLLKEDISTGYDYEACVDYLAGQLKFVKRLYDWINQHINQCVASGNAEVKSTFVKYEEICRQLDIAFDRYNARLNPADKEDFTNYLKINIIVRGYAKKEKFHLLRDAFIYRVSKSRDGRISLIKDTCEVVAQLEQYIVALIANEKVLQPQVLPQKTEAHSNFILPRPQVHLNYLNEPYYVARYGDHAIYFSHTSGRKDQKVFTIHRIEPPAILSEKSEKLLHYCFRCRLEQDEKESWQLDLRYHQKVHIKRREIIRSISQLNTTFKSNDNTKFLNKVAIGVYEFNATLRGSTKKMAVK